MNNSNRSLSEEATSCGHVSNDISSQGSKEFVKCTKYLTLTSKNSQLFFEPWLQSYSDDAVWESILEEIFFLNDMILSELKLGGILFPHIALSAVQSDVALSSDKWFQIIQQPIQHFTSSIQRPSRVYFIYEYMFMKKCWLWIWRGALYNGPIP